jgi:uncharacterized DUF497 family protein
MIRVGNQAANAWHWIVLVASPSISIDGQYLVVSHTDREDRTRIISARKMTRKERKQYEEGQEK